MSAPRCTSTFYIVIANSAQKLLPRLYAISGTRFSLFGDRLFPACLLMAIKEVQMPSQFNRKRDKYERAFNFVADWFELVVLISVCILNAQNSFNEVVVFVPPKHIQHQHHPLQIAQNLLPIPY